MAIVMIFILCVVGWVLAENDKRTYLHTNTTNTWGNLLTSLQQTLSNRTDTGSATCNNVDRKDHAIALLQEWVNHHHYDAVEKLYHDVYHHDLPRKRHPPTHAPTHTPTHYASIYAEAFNNNQPNYFHVESYVRFMMNAACRKDIMKWIEDLAKTHTPAHTNAPTHEPSTAMPTTHAPFTAIPTTAAEIAVTKQQCDQTYNKNYIIGLLQEWINHNHFNEVERIYIDLALGVTLNTDPNSALPEYQLTRNFILNNMNAICRQEVFAWIEGQAKAHTG